MQYNRPIVLSIAGFDPSGGAGILADIKSFEQNGCLGMGAVSALTAQTEDRLEGVEWHSLDKILEQLTPLFEQYEIKTVKIGIIRDVGLLLQLVQWVKNQSDTIEIVWDPVLKSTTGFELTKAGDAEALKSVLREVFLITPNTDEAIRLTKIQDPEKAAEKLGTHTRVLVTGGHRDHRRGVDVLFADGRRTEIKPTGTGFSPKHGSGCILSSAIVAGLARKLSLEAACRDAKAYVERILDSNRGLLAYHHVR